MTRADFVDVLRSAAGDSAIEFGIQRIGEEHWLHLQAEAGIRKLKIKEPPPPLPGPHDGPVDTDNEAASVELLRNGTGGVELASPTLSPERGPAPWEVPVAEKDDSDELDALLPDEALVISSGSEANHHHYDSDRPPSSEPPTPPPDTEIDSDGSESPPPPIPSSHPPLDPMRAALVQSVTTMPERTYTGRPEPHVRQQTELRRRQRADEQATAEQNAATAVAAAEEQARRTASSRERTLASSRERKSAVEQTNAENREQEAAALAAGARGAPARSRSDDTNPTVRARARLESLTRGDSTRQVSDLYWGMCS
jgi:hypothetical protein